MKYHHYTEDDWKIIVATEIDMHDKGRWLRQFTFHLDANKESCYRSRMSYNAFRHNGSQYAPTRKRETASLLYHAAGVNEKIIHDEVFKNTSQDKYVPWYDRCPVIELNDIWEFYKYVGFDYKTKKWINK